MTPQYTAIVLSIVGALLFFITGTIFQYLSIRRVARARIRKNRYLVKFSHLKTEYALKSRVRAICTERNQLTKENKSFAEKAGLQEEKTRQLISNSIKKFSIVQDEIDEKQLIIEELKQNSSNLKATIVNNKTKNEGLTEENNKLNLRIDELLNEKQNMSDEVKKLKDINLEHTENAETAKEEKIVLLSRLNIAREELEFMSDQQSELTELQNKNQELLIQNELMKEQLVELQAVREENLELNTMKREFRSLKQEVNDLKNHNSSLVSKGIALNEPPEPLTPEDSTGLGNAFQLVANKLSGNKNSRGVVVADELGLLIAGTGDHVDAMAGMAAVFSDISSIAKSILPIDEINFITISTIQDLTVTMMPFVIDSNRIIINTLSVGQGADRHQLEKIINK